MVARLQTPVSTAVKAPVVAAIEYNYERDGEIVIPAGAKAFGELDQANDRGLVAHSLSRNPDAGPDRSQNRRAVDEPGISAVTRSGHWTNAGKRYLTRP